MRRIVLFFTVSLLAINVLRAQYAVSIRIMDQNKEYVTGATFSLYNTSDSTKKWIRVSDSTGMVKLTVPTSRYTLNIEAYSFETFKKTFVINKNIDTVISLMRDAKIMKGQYLYF